MATNTFLDFVLKNPNNPWNFYSLSANPQITWDDIVTHPKLQWHMIQVLKNPNITLDMIPAVALFFNRPILQIRSYFISYNVNVVSHLKALSPEEIQNIYYCSSTTHITNSPYTDMTIIQNYPTLLPWKTYVDNLRKNIHFYGKWLELDELLGITPKRTTLTIPGINILNPLSTRDELRNARYCHNHDFECLQALTEEDVMFLANSYSRCSGVRYPSGDFVKTEMVELVKKMFVFFGACPSVTLDILERWITHPLYLSLLDKNWLHIVYEIFSRNPNVTIEFIEQHLEIEWDYQSLSRNPMHRHPCFDCMYVLK